MKHELDLEELSIDAYNDIARPLEVPTFKSDAFEGGLTRFFRTTTEESFDTIGMLKADIERDEHYRLADMVYNTNSRRDAKNPRQRRTVEAETPDYLSVWMEKKIVRGYRVEGHRAVAVRFRKVDERWYRVGLSIPGQNFSSYTFNGIETQPNQYQNPQINVVYVPPQGPR